MNLEIGDKVMFVAHDSKTAKRSKCNGLEGIVVRVKNDKYCKVRFYNHFSHKYITNVFDKQNLIPLKVLT